MKVINSILQIRLLIFLFACFLFIGSCKEPIKTEQELRDYVHDPVNNLTQVREVKGIAVSCSYLPLALRKDRLGDSTAFFVVSLSKDNKELLAQLEYGHYSEMVQVLSFRMMQYVALLVKESDPVEPLDCLFQQTYGLSNSNTLILVFNKNAIRNHKNFTVQLKEFGLGLGNLLFEYDSKDIQAIDEVVL